ncbi:MAG TPA: sigma-70 family RNA polymerase sigma factor [Chloroflexota bacterium]|jgi:RNA polymerase sigma-70 factor (ECF subfamily)
MERPSGVPSDREAFEALVENYIDRLYRVAQRITGSPQDAEDALQDALLSAYRHWGEFRHASAAGTWLYRITVNAALGRARRRQPEEYLSDTGYAQAEVVDWSEDLARRAEAAELRAILEEGILRLPADFRVTLVLRDVEGLSTAEAAAVLELSEAAVKSRLHRARVLLRQYVSTYLEVR